MYLAWFDDTSFKKLLTLGILNFILQRAVVSLLADETLAISELDINITTLAVVAG